MEILTIKLVPVSSAVTCGDAEIQQRMAESSKGKRTTQYVAYEHGRAIGFVSLDDMMKLDCLVLYELFVPARLRGAGLGKRILAEVETFARLEGYRYVRLRPWPLECGFPEERLIAWYRRNGYTACADLLTDVEKEIGAEPGA
ncbi:GNAT family N-acetyltransferase [Bradyrhizobium sp. DASA03076]|uniref:GNAT family N-acetyltransferase n=1 Tax=Bradyrhizobium sp. BLXBL-03 TaxID=3395916 RepID=UPI003F6FC9C2